MNAFPSIERLKCALDQHRPLDPAIVANLREDLIVRWTYHSNAIENNSHTLAETLMVLQGFVVGGKRVRELLEVLNHRDAILQVEELVRRNEPLDENAIRSIHHLILKGINDDNAGRYRTVNVRIGGAEHVPPDRLRVPELMERFIAWYREEAMALHPVERAARVHSDFVKIHPFVDGNGRTSRLLMNLELMKAGYPAAVLPVERRFEYYRALDQDQVHGNPGPFYRLISEIVRDSFRPYFHALSLPWDELI